MNRNRKTDTPSFDIIPILYEHGMIQEPVGRMVHCPYHADTTRSASINHEQTLFFCHACGTSGDAIKLIRDRDGCDYPTAVNKAQELSESVSGPIRKPTGRRRGLFG